VCERFRSAGDGDDILFAVRRGLRSANHWCFIMFFLSARHETTAYGSI
jgi:hypothetical protein